MNPAFISTIMAPNFEIKEITSGMRRSIPIPSIKIPVSNNNNAHSITKYGVLGRLDVQIVALHALRLVHPL